MSKKRRLKNAKEKRMDEENLTEEIEKHKQDIVDASLKFHEAMWGMEWDLDYVGFKTVYNIVTSVDGVAHAKRRLGEKYVAFSHDDVDRESTWHKQYEN